MMPRTFAPKYCGRRGLSFTSSTVHHVRLCHATSAPSTTLRWRLVDDAAVSGQPPQFGRDRYDGVVRVSTKGDYACRALLSLALHIDEPGPTSVSDIARRTGLPQPYLEQILLALKGAGLVRSKRGVGGGYILARPTTEIRLSEILSAVDGRISLGDFGEPHQDGACDHEGQCVLLAIWHEAGEMMRRHMEGFTLAEVAQAAQGNKPWPDLLASPVL